MFLHLNVPDVKESVGGAGIHLEAYGNGRMFAAVTDEFRGEEEGAVRPLVAGGNVEILRRALGVFGVPFHDLLIDLPYVQYRLDRTAPDLEGEAVGGAVVHVVDGVVVVLREIGVRSRVALLVVSPGETEFLLGQRIGLGHVFDVAAGVAAVAGRVPVGVGVVLMMAVPSLGRRAKLRFQAVLSLNYERLRELQSFHRADELGSVDLAVDRAYQQIELLVAGQIRQIRPGADAEKLVFRVGEMSGTLVFQKVLGVDLILLETYVQVKVQRAVQGARKNVGLAVAVEVGDGGSQLFPAVAVSQPLRLLVAEVRGGAAALVEKDIDGVGRIRAFPVDEVVVAVAVPVVDSG